MRIAYIVEYFPPHIGGVETLFDNLTRGVAKKHDVDVLTMAIPGAAREERSAGRTIHRVRCHSRYEFPFKVREGVRMIEKADVVHTTTFMGAGNTWLSRQFADKPTVLTFHESWRDLYFKIHPPHAAAFNYTMEWLTRFFYRNDTIVTPSNYTRDALIGLGVPGHNVHVIPHGIDHKIFKPKGDRAIDTDAPTYMFIGRPGVTKGLDYLLEAVPRIAREIPDAKFIVVVSKYDKEYRRYATRIDNLVKEGKAIQMEPLQPQTRMASVVRSADVVCVPSLSEGFGFSAVEAQACGVPVVASHAGSLPEVVSGGVLVEPKNPKAMADAVIKLLSDEKTRARLGSRGARFTKRFTWERSVREHLKLYERVASE